MKRSSSSSGPFMLIYKRKIQLLFLLSSNLLQMKVSRRAGERDHRGQRSEEQKNSGPEETEAEKH